MTGEFPLEEHRLMKLTIQLITSLMCVKVHLQVIKLWANGVDMSNSYQFIFNKYYYSYHFLEIDSETYQKTWAEQTFHHLVYFLAYILNHYFCLITLNSVFLEKRLLIIVTMSIKLCVHNSLSTLINKETLSRNWKRMVQNF